jgi:mono/diheme cytochrome c family protein
MNKPDAAIWSAAAAFLVAAAIALPRRGEAAAQTAQSKTTQQGVFTDAQAARGATVYDTNCSSCHAPSLEGSGQAPALADAEFASEWQGQPLSDLFERIRSTMPADAPGSLKAAEVADVLAFILKKGNHPSGNGELPSETDALKTITFTAKALRRDGTGDPHRNDGSKQGDAAIRNRQSAIPGRILRAGADL